MALPSSIQAILARFRGSNNNAYNASSNPLGLGQGGHRQNFGPRLQDTANVVDWMSGTVDAVDADATQTAADRVQTGQDRTAASNSAAAAAQSVTDAGGKVQLAADQVTKAQAWADAPENTEVVSGKYSARHWAAKAAAWAAGVSLPAISAANALQFLRVKSDGSGYETAPIDTYSASLVNRIPRTSNTALAKADKGALIDITTGTFTQTFVAAATLGAGWFAYIRNAGTGDITLDPNGSETIDGLTSFIMYPGEVRLIQCDGTVLRSIVVEAGAKTFTSSDNLIWPPGVNGAIVDLKNGGGGGGAGGGATAAYNGDAASRGGGGGGGAGGDSNVVQGTFPAQQPGTTTAVTVGAGGAGGVPAPAAGVGGIPGNGGSGTAGGQSGFMTLANPQVSQGGGGGVGNNGGSGVGGGARDGSGTQTTVFPFYFSLMRSIGQAGNQGGNNNGTAGGQGGNGGAGPTGIAGGTGGTGGTGASTSGNSGNPAPSGSGAGGGGGGGSGTYNGTTLTATTGGAGGSGTPGYVTVRFF